MAHDPEAPPDDFTCLNCARPLPPMDSIQISVALATMPEGFFCDECSARLAAARSFGAWLESEYERQLRTGRRAP